MPSTDVSDLRDVVEAINKLCDTMKTSYDATEEELEQDTCLETVESYSDVAQHAVCAESSHRPDAEQPGSLERELLSCVAALVSPEEVLVQRVETYSAECWRAPSVTASPPAPASIPAPTSPSAPASIPAPTSPPTPASPPSPPHSASPPSPPAPDSPPHPDPISEMYYTASSEVSLLSDTEQLDKLQYEEEVDGEMEEVKECPIAGHVAAMRERFESMTRTNTPCPDLLRSTSPSLDVFRNITPSPDFLG